MTYSISHREKKMANRTQMLFFEIIFPESKCGYGKDLLIVLMAVMIYFSSWSVDWKGFEVRCIYL